MDCAGAHRACRACSGCEADNGRQAFKGYPQRHGRPVLRVIACALLLAAATALNAGQRSVLAAVHWDIQPTFVAQAQEPASAPAGRSDGRVAPSPSEPPSHVNADEFFRSFMLPGAGLLVIVFALVLIAVLYPRRKNP